MKRMNAAERLDVRSVVAQFRDWVARYPEAMRLDDWIYDYAGLQSVYDAVRAFVRGKPFEGWTEAETRDVLYVIARDDEAGFLVDQIGAEHPSGIVSLARAALRFGESDARWQLAAELGYLGAGGTVEGLLVEYTQDDDSYVRRCSLRALARIGSPLVERLALDAWDGPDEYQESTREMVLYCLYLVGSPELPRMLDAAEVDGRPAVVSAAQYVRDGRSDLM